MQAEILAPLNQQESSTDLQSLLGTSNKHVLS